MHLEAFADWVHRSVGEPHPHRAQVSGSSTIRVGRTNNLIVYSNDILSFEKEMRHGDVHNLVLVLWRERRSTLQEAVDAAAEIHERELASYLAQEERLSSIDPQMTRYKRCLRSWVKGNVDWSLSCARYRRRARLNGGSRAGALSAY